ncbi:hypothetical protein [Actinomadura gamaensis]|uniref:Secreted protein n=1 Tax=Actinomadura gamaensis TaxID=1763541 RepID=A0ABV9TXC1_9ACTN
MDASLWVAVVTGGTAAITGWVTSQGNARAAKVQAEASQRVQLLTQRREARRTAYLEVIDHAHGTGQRYFEVHGLRITAPESERYAAELERLRDELRSAYDPLMRCVRVAELEGPPAVAEQAQALLEAVYETNRSLFHLARNDTDGARDRFTDARNRFHQCSEGFIAAAQKAINDA